MSRATETRDGMRLVARVTGTGNPIPLPEADAQRHAGPDGTGVHFNDLFFEDAGIRDGFSGNPGYLLVSKIVLHECLHVFDLKTGASSSDEFAKLVGFRRTDLGFQFTVSEKELAAVARSQRRMEELKKARDRAGVWRESRSAALSMRPVRVPALSSTTSPEEAFAEIWCSLDLGRLGARISRV